MFGLWTTGALLRAGEIQDAAAAGDLEKVRTILKAKPELANARDLGTTPLHEAASHGYLPVVELLVTSGADVNVLNSSKLTPLRLALGYQRKEVAEFLRQHGGLVSLTNATPTEPVAPPVALPPTNAAPAPRPALPVAVPEVRRPDALLQPRPAPPVTPPPVVDLPVAPPANPPVVPPAITPVTVPIHDSAELGDAEAVRAALREWPELLEAEDDKGLTPLHVAVTNAKTNVVLVLLARRARVQAATKFGWTPLHFAATNGFAPSVTLLLAYGANVNAQTTLGLTPLHLAARAGHLEVTRLLLESHANVNATEKSTGATPLHLAAENGRQAVVELLLAKGADVNAPNANGETPLTIASASGLEAMADVLRRAGARGPQLQPLSAQEQSLVEHYRGFDQVFRAGSTSEKKKAVLNTVPTKADVQKLFPAHADRAWKVVEQLNQQIHTAVSKGFKNATQEAPLSAVKPAPPSAYVQQCQTKGWLAADVPIYTLIVTKKGGRVTGEAYCFVNNRWLPLPPLDKIFPE